jgi:hypothetical protein
MIGRRLSQEEAKRLLDKLDEGSGLRRVHWSKEASGLRFAFLPFPLFGQGIKHIQDWIVTTMMEAIVR